MEINRSALDTLSSVREGIDEPLASMPPFSVLMAVYHGDNPVFFDQSLASVFEQTLPPAEVILVCDGTLTPTLEAVIARYEALYPETLRVVRSTSSQNRGLGFALSLGLSRCAHSLVARMDADDICVPHRFERQIAYMMDHPEVDMLSSTIVEFTDTPECPTGYRQFPTHHDKLKRIARYRNPINHPAAVFRRDRVLAVGGYEHFPMLEDYHLVVRLLISGGQLASLSEPLLYFRITPGTYDRRCGEHYLQNELKLQAYFRQIGFIGRAQYYINVVTRRLLRRCNAQQIRKVYKHLFREQKLKS